MGKNRALRVTLRIVLWSVVSVVFLLLAGWGTLMYVLSTPKLTSLVNKYGSQYLIADVRFESVSVSVLRSFPKLTVSLQSGEIISKATENKQDTLLSFDRLDMAINIASLLKSEILLEGVSFVNPLFRFSIAPSGKANWEIYDTGKEDSTSMGYGLDLDRLKIEGGRIIYHSLPDSIYADISIRNIHVTGMRRNQYRVDIDATTTVKMDSTLYLDGMDMQIRGGLDFDLRNMWEYTLHNVEAKMGGIAATVDGKVIVGDESIYSDLNCELPAASLSALLGLVPAGMMPQTTDVETNIVVGLKADIKGYYRFDGGGLPKLKLDMNVGGGSLDYNGLSSAVGGFATDVTVKDFALDATLYFNPHTMDSTGVVVRSMKLSSLGASFDADGQVWNLMGDPHIDACVEGSFNFDALSKHLPMPKGVEVSGRARFDIDILGRVSQMDMRNMRGAYVNAAVWLNDFAFTSTKDTISFLADKGEFTLGVNANRKVRDTLIGDNRAQVLYMTVKADTININYKDIYRIAATGTNLWARNAATSLSGDKSRVHPFRGAGDIALIEILGSDSTRIITTDAYSNFSVMPSPQDASIPVIDCTVGAMGLKVHSGVNYFQLNGTDISMVATLMRPDPEEERKKEQALDSLQVIFPEIERALLFDHMAEMSKYIYFKDDFMQYNIDMSAPSSVGALMRRWDAKGTVYAISGNITTPYFPVQNKISNIDLSFTTDRVDIHGTDIMAGRSDVRLEGAISNLKSALMEHGNLMADMKISSDTLEFSELIKALNAGGDFIYSSKRYKEELLEAGNKEQLQEIIAKNQDVSQASSLLVIPSNLNMNFDLEVGWGKYALLMMDSITMNCKIRDRALQLNNLYAQTDAGVLMMNVLYATRSKNDISAGFDLEIKDIDLAKIVQAVPEVDSLFPMMRSFEGVVNCQMAATAQLDTSTNIIFSTLQAACRLYGENMVLLDGQTFAEISKKLKFRNRDRNLINKISVEMIIKDNQVEMFPFILEIDRYRTAISGVHNLDMSFKYHISVLKSPVPFRFGLGISGTLDKIKYRVGRAKYKNQNVPTYVTLIDSTRLNLREAITDIFNKGIDKMSVSDITVVSDSMLTVVDKVDDIEELDLHETIQLIEAGVLDSLHLEQLDPKILEQRSKTVPDKVTNTVTAVSAANVESVTEAAAATTATTTATQKEQPAERRSRRRDKRLETV